MVIKSLKENIVNEDTILNFIERYVLFEFNDSVTWKQIENGLPGVICNSLINTPETVARGILRLQHRNKLYEIRNSNSDFTLTQILPPPQ